MRGFTVTKGQYDDFLYPALVNGSAQTEEELEVALRLMKKVKQLGEAESLTAEQKASKRRVIPFYFLTDTSAYLTLEEDEHKLLLQRVKDFTKLVSLGGIEDFHALLSAIKDATKIEADQVSRPAVVQ